MAQVYTFTDSNGEVRLMAEIDPAPGGSLPFVSGAGSPVGTVTPTAGKPLYIDTTNGGLYLAVGATSADWIVVGGVPGNIGEAPGFVYAAATGDMYILSGDPNVASDNSIFIGAAYSQWNGHAQGIYWLPGGNEGAETLVVRTGATAQHSLIQDQSGTTQLADGGIIFPTADPHIVGAWWDNAGVLTKSMG